VKPPPMIEALYRDLRERRLLPVVGLLVAALIAIPILLDGGTETAPPASTAATSATIDAVAAAPELDPVVLADLPGIRDFEKRLDAFRKRNPFRQQLTGPPKGLEQDLGQLQDGTQQVIDEIEDGAASALDPGGSTSGSPGSVSGPPPDRGQAGSPSGGGKVESETIIYSWKIDVKVGPPGDAEKKKGVKQLDFLPGKQRPVVQFIRGDFAEKEAVFVVSRSVDDTWGKGRCAPNRKKCEFLLLKVGQEHRFRYGPDGKTYRLKLTAVHLNEERIKGDDVSSVRERVERRSGYEALRSRITG
jgi:hypothetical protein